MTIPDPDTFVSLVNTCKMQNELNLETSIINTLRCELPFKNDNCHTNEQDPFQLRDKMEARYKHWSHRKEKPKDKQINFFGKRKGKEWEKREHELRK
jgi:hypothetical protein